MRIAIGSDHGGFDLKEIVSSYLADQGYQVLDFGTDSNESVDYPDYVKMVGQAIHENKADRGILFCGSGVGVCIAANKIPGIYAAICHDAYSARQGVEHDNMNVLCLGGRVVGSDLAIVLVREFLDARFVGNDPGQERHLRRITMITEIEKEGIQK
jgi:RpiB/LacA/LacB family sugar-phosphate isomerase